MNNSTAGALILGSVFLIVAIIVLGPIASIWALNTLFPSLAIPYTFETWLAALLLGGVFKTTVNKTK
jgi:hypothetical protein